MVITITIGVGALLVLLYLLTAGVQIARQPDNAADGPRGLLLLGAVLVVASYSYAVPNGFNVGQMSTIAFGVMGVLLVGGIALFIGEQSRDAATHARSIAGMGMAVVMLVALMAAPFLYTTFESASFTNRPDTALLDAVEAARTNAADDTGVSVASAMPTPDSDQLGSVPPASTRTPVPPTVTPTPFTYILPTPVPPVCNGLVTVNLNMREEPALNSDRVDIIPQDTVINVFERQTNDDTGEEWLRTEYNRRRGWVSASLVELNCD